MKVIIPMNQDILQYITIIEEEERRRRVGTIVLLHGQDIIQGNLNVQKKRAND